MARLSTCLHRYSKQEYESIAKAMSADAENLDQTAGQNEGEGTLVLQTTVWMLMQKQKQSQWQCAVFAGLLLTEIGQRK